MRATLPSMFGVWLIIACHHPDAPVAPGEPIPAEPDISVETADKECDGLLAALQTYGECPNADDDDRAWAKQVIKIADQSFTAGKKGEIDAKAQALMARACNKAARSVLAANERCHAGPRPRSD